MSDETPRREQWWWTEAQIKAHSMLTFHTEGRLAISVGDLVLHDGIPCGFVEERGKGCGAWLPEPPPPEEMSDEEVRGVAARLRALADVQREHDVIGERTAQDMRQAAAVVEAALEWSVGVERLQSVDPQKRELSSMTSNLMRTLRRKPGSTR